MTEQIYRKAKVIEMTGLSSSQIDRLEENNEFPRRRPISERIVGWSAKEIQGWINEKLHGVLERSEAKT